MTNDNLPGVRSARFNRLVHPVNRCTLRCIRHGIGDAVASARNFPPPPPVRAAKCCSPHPGNRRNFPLDILDQLVSRALGDIRCGLFGSIFAAAEYAAIWSQLPDG
ncbi:MAG: hypothetical protein R3C26_24215 [Calditrichia bacterium]